MDSNHLNFIKKFRERKQIKIPIFMLSPIVYIFLFRKVIIHVIVIILSAQQHFSQEFVFANLGQHKSPVFPEL
jgi:hypothetical protein